MKKLLTLLFVTLFLFTSCKEEVKPKEVETPIDVEENTEVQTPTQNEEPTEIETPIEIEQPQETEQKDFVTIKTEKDGKTTELNFEIPSEIFNVPYGNPTFTSYEDFDFGDYGLFVGIVTHSHTAEQLPEYAYGLITSETANIDESLELYNTFNKNNQAENKSDKTEPLLMKSRFYEERMLESKVVYISEEADVLGKAVLIDGDGWSYEKIPTEDDINYPSDYDEAFFERKWKARYDLTDREGNVINSLYNDEADMTFFNNYGFKEVPSHETRYSYTINGRYKYTKEESETNYKKFTYKLFPLINRIDNEEQTEMKLTIESDVEWILTDYVEDKYLLFSLYDTNNLFQKGRPLYLYDLMTSQLHLIEYYACHATISPDGKYIAYTSILYDERGSLEWNNMKIGFYIKNLETGETVFYDCEDKLSMYIQFIAGWVKEENLK